MTGREMRDQLNKMSDKELEGEIVVIQRGEDPENGCRGTVDLNTVPDYFGGGDPIPEDIDPTDLILEYS